MKAIKWLAAGVAAVFCALCAQAAEISFDRPAGGWEREYRGEGFSLKTWWMGPEVAGESHWARESLPIGNGWFGASVFGWVADERVQITHKALYLDPVYPDASQRGVATLTNTEELRTLPKLTDALELRFRFPHDPAKVTGYRRSLSLDNAIADVEYTVDGVKFRREYFASYPDKVLVARFTADKPGALSLSVRAVNPYLMDQRTGEVSAKDGMIAANQHFAAFNLDFAARVKVVSDGEVATNDGEVSVRNATKANVFMACDTNWKFDPEIMLTGMCRADRDLALRVEDAVATAERLGYALLRLRHLLDYTKLYGRVSLSLDGADEVSRKAATLFDYGRYLLIASSRPGTMPTNLQGTWNALPQAPWAGGIWMNINEQMNYWPAFSCNLAECFEPLVRFLEMSRPASREASLEYLAKYPVKRRLPPPDPLLWCVGTGMIPFRTAIPGGHSGPGTGGLTTKLLWDWWDFTRARPALEGAYPFLRGVADFDCRAVDLVDGRYLAAYSASPEQRKGTELGEAASGADGIYSTVGCAFDQQMILENDTDFLRAHRLLGLPEDALTAAVREHIGRLDPFQVGADGQLKEFREENHYGEIGEKDHRHISHLCALAPGEAISLRGTPELAAAAKRTLDLRGASGGWAAAHRMICLARLHEGDAAGRQMREFVEKEIGPNYWHIHTLSDVPVFQIDGNFGFTAAVAEMLAQGDGKGRVDLLPAIPPEWRRGGSFSGIRVRGGYVVSCAWRDGAVLEYSVVPGPDADECAPGPEVWAFGRRIGGGAAAERGAASFAAFDEKARRGDALSVVFFGGSLTYGANASDPNVTGLRGLMADYLRARYPRARFVFHDAAIGGTGSLLGAFRLERDVLAHRPDMVFLDFLCNDGADDGLPEPTCAYEYILRELVGRGIPVEQLFFTFRFWAGNGFDPEAKLPRRNAYRRLAEAYGTPSGDVLLESLGRDLASGKTTLDEVWPLDAAHPCDFGYRYFFEAAREGFARGVAEKAVCHVPERPLFGTLADVRRTRIADMALPGGWTRQMAFRTSMWFDGLSSRWMGDVAAARPGAAPLEFAAKCNFIGFFGEGDENGIPFAVSDGSARIGEFTSSPGPGRLFIFRAQPLAEWWKGARERTFALAPAKSGKGELRLESVLTATLVPTDAGAAAMAARGKGD